MKHIEFFSRNEILQFAIYDGSKVITRKSLKIRISNEHWDKKKRKPKPNCPNKELVERAITETIKKFEVESLGIPNYDENSCFLRFAENRVSENQALRTISKDKYHNYIKNVRAVVQDIFKKNELKISELRNPELLKKIKSGLRINRKNKSKFKSDTAYVDSVKAFAREMTNWNVISETPFPLNTKILTADLPKKSSKPATVLTEEQFNSFCSAYTESRSQKLAQRMYMFQYFSGGLRIFDVMLLTNKSFFDNYIQIQVLKTRSSVRIPYTLELINCLDVVFPDELKQAYGKFNFNSVKIPSNLLQTLIPYIRNWSLEDIGFEGFRKKFDWVVNDRATPSHVVEMLFQLYELVENDIIGKFVKIVRGTAENFVFPILNYEDFKDVLYDTSKLSVKHNKLAHNGRQRHLQALKRFCEANEFPKLSGHSPRHSFVSKLDKDGYALEQIRDVLAHKDEKTTLIYLRNRHPKSTALNTLRDINRKSRIRRVLG